MKKAKKLLVAVACLGGVGFAAFKLLKSDAAQEKLFSILGDDTYLSLLSLARLMGDLLAWPYHFVQALLP